MTDPDKTQSAAAASPSLVCECYGMQFRGDVGVHSIEPGGPPHCNNCGRLIGTMDDMGTIQGDVPTAEDRSDIGKPYRALNAGAEWWAIIARGSLAFRFGPYTGPEVGKIMERCNDERIACLITGNCGKDFDWELARDLCQKKAKAPEPDQPAAPTEGGDAC